MSAEFLETIKKNVKIPLFTDDDLKVIFKDKPPSAIHNSLTYHLRNKKLVRYKRGLYSLAPEDNLIGFSKFHLANKLVTHSFISFESALSYYNLIPERVYETTSASLLKNKSFQNVLGRFSFTYSPVNPFYMGVKKDDFTNSKIANPVRALFDLIYSRRKNYHELLDLESDLRIDLDEFQKLLKEFKASEILKLAEAYNKKTTTNLANLLIKDLM